MESTTIILTSIPIQIIVTVLTPFPAAFAFAFPVPVPAPVLVSILVPVPVPVPASIFTISAITTVMMIARMKLMVMVMVMVVVVVAHTLEQAQVANRWRRIVALPRSPKPNLRIFLSETVATGVGAWAAWTTFCASDSTIAHVPRIGEPIALVVLFLLL